MQKIKLITDSGSDIEKTFAEQLDIEILSFNVLLDGKDYKDGVDYTADEFYDLFEKANELPKTGQILPQDFEDAYKNAFDEGYTDIIYYSLASIGSGTYFNSIKAKDKFFEENPDAKINIYLIDSKTYSGTYGSAVINASHKIKKGETASEIVEYLKEWADCAEVYFAPFTLKYVRKSGRISAAAAFAGELLGLRPIIGFIEAISKVVDKARGDKNVVPHLLKVVSENIIPKTPYYLLITRDDEHAKELLSAATKTFGYPPEHTFKVGATIATHAGPSLVGVAYRGKMRNGGNG
ncbi:DegV family protein [Clostridia bacterium]|nr:DegV family protein [Clostridia bacterium]